MKIVKIRFYQLMLIIFGGTFGGMGVAFQYPSKTSENIWMIIVGAIALIAWVIWCATDKEVMKNDKSVTKDIVDAHK